MGHSGLVKDAHRFAPAASGEDVVYGACCPGWHSAGEHGRVVEEWISFMRRQAIERVCCLVPGRELGTEGGDLALYREAFGRENVCHAPIPADHLASEATLRRKILPFLETSAETDAPVVVHSMAGIGRTGHVLAAWLTAYRGYVPHEAIETVEKMGRDPTEPIDRGNATHQDLLDSLSKLR